MTVPRPRSRRNGYATVWQAICRSAERFRGDEWVEHGGAMDILFFVLWALHEDLNAADKYRRPTHPFLS